MSSFRDIGEDKNSKSSWKYRRYSQIISHYKFSSNSFKFLFCHVSHIASSTKPLHAIQRNGIGILTETIRVITSIFTNNNWLGNRIMHPVFVKNIWFTQRFLIFGALTEGRKLNEEEKQQYYFFHVIHFKLKQS